VRCAHYPPVADERVDRAGQVLHFADHVLARRWLEQLAGRVEVVDAVQCPVQDAGQLGEQLAGEAGVLAAEEALGGKGDDEPAGQRAGGVAELGQLVAEHQQPCRQRAGPRLAVLPVDGEQVLAGDRQQPFDDDAGALPDPRIKPTTITRLERGRRPIPIHELIALGAVLGVGWAELVMAPTIRVAAQEWNTLERGGYARLRSSRFAGT
jgi:hypothetical protein